MNSLSSLWAKEERRRRIGRIIRRVVGIPLLLFSYPHLGPISPFLLLLGAILVAPDIAGFLSNAVVGMVSPHRPGERRPNYDIPESLAAKGKYAEAEEEYDRIIQEFPAEVKPHIAMINIAVTRLNDGALAASLYQNGMDRLKDPASRETLTTMYKAMATRLKPVPRSDAGSQLPTPEQEPRGNPLPEERKKHDA